MTIRLFTSIGSLLTMAWAVPAAASEGDSGQARLCGVLAELTREIAASRSTDLLTVDARLGELHGVVVGRTFSVSSCASLGVDLDVLSNSTSDVYSTTALSIMIGVEVDKTPFSVVDTFVTGK